MIATVSLVLLFALLVGIVADWIWIRWGGGGDA